MKTILVTLMVGLLAQQTIRAQGTMTYLSNLNQTSTGSAAVGNDSWLAGIFLTGTNAGGYSLDSVQLAMANASGNPNGFTVMIYSETGVSGFFPGTNISTLTGSLSPATAGIYTYTPASSLTLSSSATYFIVLTAETTIANGAYGWSYAGLPPRNDGWGGGQSILDSNNNSQWNFLTAASAQFSITATAIPEPPSAFLLLLGSGVLPYVRRIFHR